ncbi:c-type cytochrome [Beijerinckia indica]|uniref:Gluconate 2-dehydrogenase (Acceptor) n=1 Tax=Beijerinckia indica subsp. indica (strain ATCC 9039 / DSM 1715 / NCIMB 8712) TaxID=395963 RepID=B2IDZ4_BEII9|nr:c-type cytochrome [Beijerinckia indica]ACB96926.1 Gluconate 2-dehydrogenase (acceptor) [Beijerinckia indica subsp. indica ATCC 9039]
MFKRLLIGAIAAAVLGFGGFIAFAWRPAIAPITPPAPSSFDPALVARGEVLAGAGYCSACHTPKGGKPFSGGRPMFTDFGTIYATNITPDPKTGIGDWSEEAFRRAVWEGVARDGSHILPAFPFDHLTKLSEQDVKALYAYFMTREPVEATAPENTIPFPMNIRLFQAGWKLLFFRPGRFEPRPDKSEEWNRGAYLAEGISHCGACHTPRNLLGAEKPSATYAGAFIDNWVAPPLDKSNPSPVPWSRDELYTYLRTGLSRYHGTASGPMSPVVHDGLKLVSDADVRAIATYFADIDQAAARASEETAAVSRALAASKQGVGLSDDSAAKLYTAACASCHYNGGEINPLRPDLALNSAVNLDDPTNLIRIILFGVDVKEGASDLVMPAFASGFSDADVAHIAAYLRATRTSHAPWPELEQKVASIRAQGKTQE